MTIFEIRHAIRVYIAASKSFIIWHLKYDQFFKLNTQSFSKHCLKSWKLYFLSGRYRVYIAAWNSFINWHLKCDYFLNMTILETLSKKLENAFLFKRLKNVFFKWQVPGEYNRVVFVRKLIFKMWLFLKLDTQSFSKHCSKN